MAFFKTSTALCLMAGLIGAQGQLPISLQASIYKHDPRGMSFDAPVDFTITGLRTPDTAKLGLQSIAVYLIKNHTAGKQTAPTPVFWAGGVKSATLLATAIGVTKGDHVVIISDAHRSFAPPSTNPGLSNCATSYGVPNFGSNVLGHPVKLRRVTATRTTWYPGKGKADIYTNPFADGAWGRTEVYIKGQKPWSYVTATATNYGEYISTQKSGPKNSTFVPLPPHSRIYNATTSQGYYFQAPVDFLVDGMSLPSSNPGGKYQAVALHAAQTRWAAWPAFTIVPNGNYRFWATGLRTAGILRPSTPIKIHKGEWVGVMGVTYDKTSATEYMSFGRAGAVFSNVLGHGVFLRALSMSGSILTPYRYGIGNYSTEDKREMARVELHIVGQNAYSQPALPPTLNTTATPILGSMGRFVATAGLTGAQGGIIMMSNGRLPSVVTPFGKLNILPNVFWSGFLVKGEGTVSLPIPTHRSLLKTKVTFQTLVWNIAASGNTFGMSNGTEWMIGNY